MIRRLYRSLTTTAATLALATALAGPVTAQGVPTVDTQNIAQEIRQLQQMLQDFGIQTDLLDNALAQLDLLQQQFDQLEEMYASLTGPRSILGLAMGGEGLRRERNTALREVVASGDISAALSFCVENKLNMIVSGGTSTGKTVAARKILSLIPAEERIVTIEEAAELRPEQPNVVTLIADRDTEARCADSRAGEAVGTVRQLKSFLGINAVPHCLASVSALPLSPTRPATPRA